jgi:hypothetical protein
MAQRPTFMQDVQRMVSEVWNTIKAVNRGSMKDLQQAFGTVQGTMPGNPEPGTPMNPTTYEVAKERGAVYGVVANDNSQTVQATQQTATAEPPKQSFLDRTLERAAQRAAEQKQQGPQKQMEM